MKHLLLAAALFSLLLAGCNKKTVPTPPEPALANAATASASKKDVQPTQIPNAGETKTYTAADVALHSTASDCWLIIGGKVYDVTEYLPSHPAGAASITRSCGKDVTQGFSRHSERAQAFKEKFLIGNLAAQ